MRTSELESFRIQAIAELKKHHHEISDLCYQTTGMRGQFRIIGSVTNPDVFNENSDVDGAWFVRVPERESGVLEIETEKLQRVFEDLWFSFGILNIGVINA